MFYSSRLFAYHLLVSLNRVCGAIENASGYRSPGVTTAITSCRLHHLPFYKLREIERDNPALALHLYKVLSYIMAHREEVTVQHLLTLHHIMSSPGHSKRPGRRALRAMAAVS